MSKGTLNRRAFLRGLGGATMAIPFLPSLHHKAFAAAPALTSVPKRFFALRTAHGGVWHENMFPEESMLSGEPFTYAGREVRWGALPTSPDDQNRVHWSPVCQADASRLTPSLAAKFNILKGLDIPWQPGHQAGVNLGNFTQSGIALNTQLKSAYRNPTIDQVMAYSSAFYTPEELQSSVIRRSFHIGHGFSFNYQKALDRSGPITLQPTLNNNLQLFDYLFKATSSLQGMDQLIVDRVKESYDQLKANPKLSKGDLLRLEQHIEKMFEVERLVTLSSTLTGLPERPTEDTDSWTYKGGFGTIPHNLNATVNYLDLMLDVAVLALSAGVSRIGTWGQDLWLAANSINDWHGSVAHEGAGPVNAQAYTVEYNQKTFEHVMVELASRLDAITMSDGQTLLDHTLITFTQESGQISHHTGCRTMPIVTAGGGSGVINTGNFVDYSDTSQTATGFSAILGAKPGLRDESPGLLYNQFLTTCMFAMSVPTHDWGTFTEITEAGPGSSAPVEGFGHLLAGSQWDSAKPVLGEPLPLFSTSET